jgi:DNA-binding response OmpR family regulator
MPVARYVGAMTGVRILVVDDEPKIREVVVAHLEAEGFQIAERANGEDAVAAVRAFDPDVVILDVMLPGIDGIEVLRRIRTFSDVYVVMLTARAEEVDKLVGLSIGADDYMTKPFSPRELVARVRAVLRRARGHGSDEAEVLRFDGLAIDRSQRLVVNRDAEVQLSALEFDLLVAMAESPGRVFTRRQLIDRVWGWDFFGDERVVDVHIRSLRSTLGDDAANPSIIGTVRGVGYRFLPRS